MKQSDSQAGKAIQNHNELAFLLMLKNKWREEGLNYTEVSDFLKDYFTMTKDISWEELHLYGLAVKEINQLEKNELEQCREGYLFLKSDVPFMGWAYMWYDFALYEHMILDKEPTEEDLRRLAYRNGQDYEKIKSRDESLEIAGKNATYTFWD